MFNLQAKRVLVLTTAGEPAVYETREGARRAAIALAGAWKTPVSIVAAGDDERADAMASGF